MFSLDLGCEAIVSFDRDKLDPKTEPPIVIPARDGGVRVDAGSGSAVPDDEAGDADLDASDDAEAADGNLSQDGSLDAELGDAALDADVADADLDAVASDAAVQDASGDGAVEDASADAADAAGADAGDGG